jgi:hypothetical protein
VKFWGPSLTPKNMTGKPSVRVSQVPVNGNTAKIPARDIHVNGQSVVANSHQLRNVHFDTTRIKGSWYVSGMK